MAALTYTEGRTATVKTATEAKAPSKSFFRRFMDAMIEARMQQVQREMRAFRHVALRDSTDKTTGGI